jgi:hypothetical protein
MYLAETLSKDAKLLAIGNQWRTQNEFGVGAKCVSGGTSNINSQIVNIFWFKYEQI